MAVPPHAAHCSVVDDVASIDLLLDLDELLARLPGLVGREWWLDAYLVASGALQVVEDHQERDAWILRRAATSLRRRGGAHPRTAAAVLEGAAAVVDVVRQAVPAAGVVDVWSDRLAGVRDRLARIVMGAPAKDYLVGLTRDAEHVVAEARALPRALRSDVARLPACFRSFDQRPKDLARLAHAVVDQHGLPGVVVGVRTSGSFLAPLLAAALPCPQIVTVRPGRPLPSRARLLLRDAVGAGRDVVVVDDAPVTGNAVRDAVRALGVPESAVVLGLQTFEDDLPPVLRRFRSTTLPLRCWAIHQHLTCSAVSEALRDLLEEDVLDIAPLPTTNQVDRAARGHLSRRFRVRISGLPEQIVHVRGAGLGYLGRHVQAVTEAFPDHVPRLHGVRDGLVYREWLQDAQRLSELDARSAEHIARYIAARTVSLPAPVDRTRQLGGRSPVWEVGSKILSHGFGRAGDPLRPLVLDPVLRRLLTPTMPTIVDGGTALHHWFDDGKGLRTVGIDVHAFSNRDLACCDPDFDVAGVDPGGRRPHVQMVADRCRRLGVPVEPSRVLVHELVHLWNDGRHGLTPHDVARASSRAVQRYLAAHFLADVPAPPADGPLVALDCDGVVETSAFGFSAPTPASMLALRALAVHGFRPVLVTGRSLDEVRERCETYRLAGGVAEYGSVVHRQQDDEVVDLVPIHERRGLDALRTYLVAVPSVHVEIDHEASVRASHHEPDGKARAVAEDVVAAALRRAGRPRVQVIHGDDQTDVVAGAVDKGRGLSTLSSLLGDAPVALAVGDTEADRPMLRMGQRAGVPAHASRALTDVATRHRGQYQRGLLDATAALLGHRPGHCRACRVPTLDEPTRTMLALLAAPEGGRRRLPAGLLGVVTAVAPRSGRS